MGQGPNETDERPEPPYTECLFTPNSSGLTGPGPDGADQEPPTEQAKPRTPPTLHLPAPTPPGLGSEPAGSGSSHWETLDMSGDLQPGQVILGKYVIVRKL